MVLPSRLFGQLKTVRRTVILCLLGGILGSKRAKRLEFWWDEAWGNNATAGQYISFTSAALFCVITDVFILKRSALPEIVKDVGLASLLATFLLAASSLSKKEGKALQTLTFNGASAFGTIIAMMVVPDVANLFDVTVKENSLLTASTVFAAWRAMQIGLAFWEVSAMSRIFRADKANQLGHFTPAVEVVLLGLMFLKEHEVADELTKALGLNQHKQVLKRGGLFDKISAMLRTVPESQWTKTLKLARKEIREWEDRLLEEADNSDDRQTRTKMSAVHTGRT